MPQIYGDDLVQIAPNGSHIHIFTVPTIADRDRIGSGAAPQPCRIGSIAFVVADQCYYRLDTTAPTWTMLGKDLFGTGVVSSPGALSGAAPTGAQVGVDVSTGALYYVDGAGNWQPVPGSSVVVVSADANNLISAGSDGGAHLEGADLVSGDLGNILSVGTDGALFVPAGMVTVVSTDAGNVITVGSDGGALLNAAAIQGAVTVVSADANNLLDVGSDSGAHLEGADLVSADANNDLSVGSDGALFVDVPATTVVSADANNDITVGSDGGAYLDVPAPTIVSADANNLLDVGSDTGAHLEGADLVSTDASNILVVGTDGALYVPPDASVTVVSADAGNDVVAGSDGGAFFQETDNVSADANNLLDTGSDAGAHLEGADLVSTDASNAVVVGSDGALFVPVATAPTIVSADANNDITVGSDGGAYLDVPAVTVVSADAGNDVVAGSDGGAYFQETDNVSADANNLLDTGSDAGAHLEGADLVSTDPTNILAVGSDGALFVPPDASVTVVSADAGNDVVAGSDGGAYFQETPNVSTDANNDIVVGSDGGAYLDVPAVTVVSADAGNDVVAGSDGGAYFQETPNVSADANNLLDTGSDAGAHLEGADLVSADAGNDLSVGSDGALFVDVPAVTVVSADANNDIVVGSDGGAYLDVPAPTIVSADANNLLDVGSDSGAHLEGADLVSADAGNDLSVGSDGALFVDVPAVTVVSADAGNDITVGSDGGAYFDETPNVSADANNDITVGSDGGAYLDVPAPLIVSADAGNDITVGSDGGAYFDETVNVSADAGNLIDTGSDGGAHLEGADLVSADAGNTLVVGTDGALFVPAGGSVVLSTDPGNDLSFGTDSNLYAPNEVISNAGPLTGVAPAGAQFGIDTNTGERYYVDAAGNWQPVEKLENPAWSVGGSYTIYYSDVTGDDIAGDGSIGNPFRTLECVIARIPHEGDGTIRSFVIIAQDTGAYDYPVPEIHKNFEQPIRIEVHAEMAAPVFTGTLTTTEISPGTWEANVPLLTGPSSFAAVFDRETEGQGRFFGLPVVTGDGTTIEIISPVDPATLGTCEIRAYAIVADINNTNVATNRFHGVSSTNAHVILSGWIFQGGTGTNDNITLGSQNDFLGEERYNMMITACSIRTEARLMNVEFSAQTEGPLVPVGGVLIYAGVVRDPINGARIIDVGPESTVYVRSLHARSIDINGGKGVLDEARVSLSTVSNTSTFVARNGGELSIRGGEMETGFCGVTFLAEWHGRIYLTPVATTFPVVVSNVGNVNALARSGSRVQGIIGTLGEPGTSLQRVGGQSRYQVGSQPSISEGAFTTQAGENDLNLGKASEGNFIN